MAVVVGDDMGALSLAVPFMYPLALTVTFAFTMSMGARAVAPEGDEADAFWRLRGWLACDDYHGGAADDGLGPQAKPGRAVDELREEVG